MTDKHQMILKAIAIGAGTILVIVLITVAYVLFWYAKRIEREVYIGW